MNDYPAGLPLARQSDRKLQTVDPTLRSDLESGRARQRQRYDFVPDNAAVNWLFSPEQCRLFKLWHRVTLGNGAEWFDMPLKTDLGVTTQRMRFVGMYDGPVIAGYQLWSISATLELEERAMLDDEWVTLPSFVLRPDIFDIAINRLWPSP